MVFFWGGGVHRSDIHLIIKYLINTKMCYSHYHRYVTNIPYLKLVRISQNFKCQWFLYCFSMMQSNVTLTFHDEIENNHQLIEKESLED